VYEAAKLESGDTVRDAYTAALIRAVWDKYGTLAPFQLVEITHLPGGPWAAAIEAGDRYIDNEKIKTYFEKLATEGL